MLHSQIGKGSLDRRGNSAYRYVHSGMSSGAHVEDVSAEWLKVGLCPYAFSHSHNCAELKIIGGITWSPT